MTSVNTVNTDDFKIVDVVIVGGGPAGLAAACELKRLGVGSVIVLERELEAGGVPRHCHHTGFGWFDTRRVSSGPSYARRYAANARSAGVEIRASTTALDWRSGGLVTAVGPNGPLTVQAKAVLLATGCRERPRSARLVPGDRPAGVYTTGSLQQLVYGGCGPVGARAVIVGAEHVSYSAVQTLRHGGARVAAMITEHPRTQTLPLVHAACRAAFGIPLIADARVTRVIGARRVTGVEVKRGAAAPAVIPCDTVVFTGGWIPDHELARRSGIALDPRTLGPAVDGALRAHGPGVFAAGNLVHPAEMADFAALGGRHAAKGIAAFLAGGPATSPAAIPVAVDDPLLWICPNRISAATPPLKDRYILRTKAFVRQARIVVEQEGRVVAARPYGSLIPNRSIYFPAGFEGRLSPSPVRVRVEAP